jgi:hypothetical protein
MKSLPPLFLALTSRIPTPHFALTVAAATAVRPKVLSIIADDASCHFGEADGCTCVKAPNIDRLTSASRSWSSARNVAVARIPVSACRRGISKA